MFSGAWGPLVSGSGGAIAGAGVGHNPNRGAPNRALRGGRGAPARGVRRARRARAPTRRTDPWRAEQRGRGRGQGAVQSSSRGVRGRAVQAVAVDATASGVRRSEQGMEQQQ